MRRTLTKKHLFDWEMKYKDKVKEQKFDKLTLRNFDTLIYKNLHYSFQSDYNLVTEFIDDYMELIDFDRFIYQNWYFVNEHLYKFVNKYEKYIGDKGWSHIHGMFSVYNNEKFIMKYIDRLDIQTIITKHEFSPKLLLFLKDRMTKRQIKEVISKIRYHNGSVISQQMLKYTVDHLEEVLTYTGNKEVTDNE